MGCLYFFVLGCSWLFCFFFFFFFNDTATTEIYTLSLHDALPVSARLVACSRAMVARGTSWATLPRSPSAGGPVFRVTRIGRPNASVATSERSLRVEGSS